MIVAGALLGAAWGAIPGVLRAFLHTNEIITSLMLNYVAGAGDHLPDLRQPVLLARRLRNGSALPAGEAAARIGNVADDRNRPRRRPVRVRRRDRRRGGGLGALLAHAVRVRGAGDRRLTPSRALRRDADASQDRRDHVPLGRDRRDRWREPERRLPSRPRPTRPAAGELRLRGDRRRRARALQPVRGRARRLPPRRAPERRLRAAGRRLPVRASSA